MWVLNGPFDGETKGEVGFTKAKLLKTSTVYNLGRKDVPLAINSPKISHKHCVFTVNKYTEDDVANPLARPTLELLNSREKLPLRISRGDHTVAINPLSSGELQDGDIVYLAAGSNVSVSIHWEPICCYLPNARDKSNPKAESCASLGITLVHTQNLHVTHHLTDTFTEAAGIAASLLSLCQFVRPEWLSEVLRLGDLSVDSSTDVSLEKTFMLPPVAKYRPTFSDSLPASLKAVKVWERNEERINMFKGYRFLFVGEKGREIDSGSMELLVRGGAAYEGFNVASDKAIWHSKLVKASGRTHSGGKGIVLVANQDSMKAAVGNSAWLELVNEAQTFGLHFVSPEDVVKAVIYVDRSYINSSDEMNEETQTPQVRHQSSSPLPSFVPNTHPDEPSLPPESPPGPSRKLRKRVPSREPSQGPSNPPLVEDETEAPRPRKPLVRRTGTGRPLIIGIDDPSYIIDSTEGSSLAPPPPLPEPEKPLLIDLTAPAPARSSRLKRRAGTTAPVISVESYHPDPVAEPPNKKYKALFDESDPARMSADTFDAILSGDTPPDDVMARSDTFSQSQTQTQTQTQVSGGRALRSAMGAATLEAVREEEEETQSGSRGTKRKADGDEDIHMADVDQGRSVSVPPKRRAVENVNAVQPSKPTVERKETKPVLKSAKSGAAPGKPDTDIAFLKAIASTKRGKRTEDDFDREFNKLKISKPDLGYEEPEKEWAVLEDFGDDSNVRGNFMVVVEMDVYRKEGQVQARASEVRPEWQTLPNFKKFKKKDSTVSRTRKVDLVASVPPDYGVGPAYWKGSSSRNDFGASQKRTHQSKSPSPVQASRRARSRAISVDDFDEEPPAPRRGRSKAPSSVGSTMTQKRTSTRGKKAPQTAEALFLDSDDDDDDTKIKEAKEEANIDAFAGHDEDEGTLRSSGGTKSQAPARRSTRGKKVQVLVVDDDSDDDAVFEGFNGKRKGR